MLVLNIIRAIISVVSKGTAASKRRLLYVIFTKWKKIFSLLSKGKNQWWIVQCNLSSFYLTVILFLFFFFFGKRLYSHVEKSYLMNFLEEVRNNLPQKGTVSSQLIMNWLKLSILLIYLRLRGHSPSRETSSWWRSVISRPKLRKHPCYLHYLHSEKCPHLWFYLDWETPKEGRSAQRSKRCNK